MEKVFEALEILSRALEFNDEGEFQSGRLWRIIFNDMVDDKDKSIIEQAITELKAIKEVKPSEAINYLDQFINEMTRCLENPKQYAKNYDKEIFYKYKHTLETTIKQALLKQLSGSQYTNIFIDEATLPNTDSGETLRKLRELRAKPFNWETLIKVLDEVEQSLLKAQEQEKVLEILKPLCEVVETPVKKLRYLKINGVVVYTFKNQEEFETLKQYFEKNIQNQ